MKNHNKATANYIKQFIKKKGKSLISQIKDFENSGIGSFSKCKFCKKVYESNKYWHLQA